MADTVIVNGELTEQISVYDRGLAYGDGVFETILCRDGKLLLWERHLERLISSLVRLRIEPFEHNTLLTSMQPYLVGVGEQIVKIIVSRGNSRRGYAIPEQTRTNTIIFIANREKPKPDIMRVGVKTRICETRLAYQPKLAGLKHLNRLEQVLAQMELSDSKVQEGIMLGLQGEVIEATRHNLFLVKNGELFTPELSNCGVAGIMRTFIIEIAQQQGVEIHCEKISVKQLMQADEIFLSNSINGIWPVCELDGAPFEIGKVTCQLQDRVVELTSIA